MRCPKCGFISFDHLEECLKCSKNIKSTSDTLKGTVYNIAAPVFLLFEEKSTEDNNEGAFETTAGPEGVGGEEITLDEEFVDSELDILVPDEEEGENFEISLEDESGSEIDLATFDEPEEPEESGEIEIDMAQFEDSFATETAAEEPKAEEIALETPDESFEISIPEELDDISDLGPPAVTEETPPAAPVAAKSEIVAPPANANSETGDIDLDGLDFDLGLDGLDGTPASVDSQSPVMDLDDIDFSDALDQVDSGPEKKKRSTMDDDLDFDLDLGGLSLKKDE